mmetsp:Transcript_11037/g.38332  ORF Transcript_11037/g.38332 Transcript_11037/m.38332 type:complete len:337 (+) Transcript_11037:284-1294(+)
MAGPPESRSNSGRKVSAAQTTVARSSFGRSARREATQRQPSHAAVAARSVARCGPRTVLKPAQPTCRMSSAESAFTPTCTAQHDEARRPAATADCIVAAGSTSNGAPPPAVASPPVTASPPAAASLLPAAAAPPPAASPPTGALSSRQVNSEGSKPAALHASQMSWSIVSAASATRIVASPMVTRESTTPAMAPTAPRTLPTQAAQPMDGSETTQVRRAANGGARARARSMVSWFATATISGRSVKTALSANPSAFAFASGVIDAPAAPRTARRACSVTARKKARSGPSQVLKPAQPTEAAFNPSWTTQHELESSESAVHHCSRCADRSSASCAAA